MGSVEGQLKSTAKKTGCASVEEWKAKRAAGLRWCFDCRQWRDIELFQKDSSRKGGLASRCKPCMSIASTACRRKVSKSFIRKIRSQNKCDICGLENQKWEIDHDHSTGLIRGLLCSRCNSAIGMFLESPELMLNAIRYLEFHKSKNE